MIWTNKKKEKIPMSDMSTEHINKCVSMLKEDIDNYMLNIVELTSKTGYIRDLVHTDVYSKVNEINVQITLAKCYLKVFKRELKRRRKIVD